MIELAKEFVPCTDEVYRLETENEPDCKFFQAIARQGHYASDRTPSKQGIYVVSASGKFLSSINSNNANAVIKTLKTGLARFESLDDSQKVIADPNEVSSNARNEKFQPEGGLILAIHSRDLPEDLDPKSEKAVRWNRDTAWFTKTEVLSMILPTAKVGEKFKFANVFTNRMAQLHLVDMILGQTDSFAESEVQGTEIFGVIKRVTADEIEFEIQGSSESDSDSTMNRRTARGVVTSIFGNAIYSKSKQTFSQFKLIAVGHRWGRTRFNGRRRGPKNNPVGFVVELAPAEEPANVPGLFYEYDADWEN